MRAEYVEAMSDFCFRSKVLSINNSPTGHSPASIPSAQDINPSIAHRIPALRMKVDAGVNWALPFLFGLLGTLIHLLRTIGDERQRPMSLDDVTVRLCLGSVGGIITGWFASSLTPALNGSLGAISVPLALAFLTGYGIEILFRVLDRLSRAVGRPPSDPGAPGTGAVVTGLGAAPRVQTPK